MSEQPQKTPKKDTRNRRLPRTATLWFLFALLSLLAFQFMRGNDRGGGEVSYTELHRQIESDNVLKVTFQGDP